MAFSFIVAKPTEKPSVENNFTKVAFGDRSVTLYDDDSKALADTLTPNDTMFTAGSFAMVPTPGGTFPRVDAKAFANANATQDTTFMVIYGVVATKPVVNLSGASFILKTAHYRANPGKFVTNWKVCITDSALRGIINTLQESKPVLAFGTFQLTDQGPLLHANFLDYLPEVSRAFQKPGWGSPTPAKSSWGTTATATTAPATDAWGSTASSATSTPAPKEAWACATSPGAITPAWDTHKSALMPNSKVCFSNITFVSSVSCVFIRVLNFSHKSALTPNSKDCFSNFTFVSSVSCIFIRVLIFF